MLNKERKYFNIDSIMEVFREFGSALETPVHGLLIGGGAMSLRGIKDVTKDVDMVITDKQEHQAFLSCAYKLGFEDKTVVFPGYENLHAVALVNADEFHIDLFQTSVAGHLRIHDGIVNRAEEYKKYGNLTISLMANEDLFISKSITGRDRDLEDMQTLYRMGLDAGTIIRELERQDALTPFLWEAYMGVKLGELEEEYEMTVPWKEKVEEIAVRKLSHQKES